MFRELSSAELNMSDVPPVGAAWDRIHEFALSFNGYKSLEKCEELANATISMFREDENLPVSLTLDELRACLFFEQRRWRHFGENPGSEDMKYIYHLIEAIRETIKSREKGKK